MEFNGWFGGAMMENEQEGENVNNGGGLIQKIIKLALRSEERLLCSGVFINTSLGE